MFHVLRNTVLKIYTSNRKSRKISSAKSQRRQKSVLDDRDKRPLKSIVTENKMTTAAKVTAELNVGLSNPASALRMQLHNQEFFCQVAISKALILMQMTMDIELCQGFYRNILSK